MSTARERILAKLSKANAYPMREPEIAQYYELMSPSWESKVARLQFWAKTMRAVKGEIYWVRANNWEETFKKVVAEKGLKNILLPLATAHGKRAQLALQDGEVAIKTFTEKMEDWKEAFFNEIEAGFTDAQCAIAQTGTLMLYGSPEQPRTQSLVPPIHICLLDASKMYDTFYDALCGEKMAENMPTNAILISGPSKTSDIQLTLAFGAHGPRDLVVLAIVPDDIDIADLD